MNWGAAILVTLAAAILWGLWWLPIRALESVGLGGAWAGLAMSLGALPALAALALVDRSRAGAPDARRRGARGAVAGAAGAALIGLALALYAASVAYTDVVRAALLFYLAPTWSVLIEGAFLGRRWSSRSLLAIALSLIGALAIFRGEVGLDGWSAGDAMALASGMAWSAGAALVFAAPARRATSVALAAGASAALCGAVLALLAAPGALAVPREAAAAAALWALAAGALYVAPVLVATLWGALRLPPATLSFLLTAEIVSGVGSAALLLDERFGLPEAIGTLLILSAALLEARRSAPAGAAAP